MVSHRRSAPHHSSCRRATEARTCGWPLLDRRHSSTSWFFIVYVEHPKLSLPSDLQLRTWRFMDFIKFVALLEESSLYFSRLTELSDPLEGFLSKPVVQQMSTPPAGLSAEELKHFEDVRQHNLGFMRWSRELLFVSCWHLNEHESAAMWRLYLKSDEGVAVQSTLARMIQAFTVAPRSVFMGQMAYIDYDVDSMPTGNGFFLALHKRRSFEHERELRAIVTPHELEDRIGIIVPVDLRSLIERVFVAPNSHPWVRDLVQKVLARFQLDVPVVHSALDDRPLY